MAVTDILGAVSQLSGGKTGGNLMQNLAVAKNAFSEATASIDSLQSGATDKMQQAKALSSKFEEWKREKKMNKIMEDVDIAYDEASNTFNITSGNIDAKTMKALKEYFKEADGEYDAANIVIGEQVSFDREDLFKRDIRFDFKCASVDIQSHDLTDASSMFEDADIERIKIADQPNLSNVDEMFKHCRAASIEIGEIPASIDREVMTKDCMAEFHTDVASRGAKVDAELDSVLPDMEQPIVDAELDSQRFEEEQEKYAGPDTGWL